MKKESNLDDEQVYVFIYEALNSFIYYNNQVK